MQHSRFISVFLWSIVLEPALAQSNASYFRPKDVIKSDSMGEIYKWAGSYYNGTAQLELTVPSPNLDRWNTPCSNYNSSTTVIRHFNSIFAVIEPSNQPSSVEVNMVWGLWPLDFNFTSWADSGRPSWTYSDSDKSGTILGSLASIDLGDTVVEVFKLGVSKSNISTYNASTSRKTAIGANWTPIRNVSMPACKGDKDRSWSVWPGSLPQDTLDVQFDSKALTASYVGVRAGVQDGVIQGEGNVKITMSGVIDSWHSDLLNTDGERPAWTRTVGYDQGYWAYQNITTSSASRCAQSKTVISVVAGLVAAILTLIY